LRDYGVEGQLGLEKTPEEYVSKMVEIFREVRRVLRKDGTLWLNLGDSYAGSMKGIGADGTAYGGPKQRTNSGSIGIMEKPLKAKEIGLKPKDLVGIPWMVAFALRADGWYLRSDIIWHKPNVMPESVKDRPTKAHEYLFLLSKSPKYYYDYMAISEEAKYAEQHAKKSTSWGTNRKHPNKNNVEKYAYTGDNHTTLQGGRKNKRTVWNINTRPFKGAHFAVFPPDLVEPCILAGCPKDGIVLDPFMGSGTTGMVAAMHQRNFIGFELNPEYCKMAERRIESYLMQQTIFDLQNISANNT
jgi:DNA modification methylase